MMVSVAILGQTPGQIFSLEQQYNSDLELNALTCQAGASEKAIEVHTIPTKVLVLTLNTHITRRRNGAYQLFFHPEVLFNV